MKYLTIMPKLALLLTIFQSCNSQKLKLENIQFTENVNQVIKNVVFDVDKKDPFFPGMTTYQTSDNNLLQYDGVYLNNKAKERTEQNRIYFVTENDDSTIIAVNIDIHNSSMSQELLRKIEEKLGKGKVLENSVRIRKDKEKFGSVNYLWDDNKQGTTFLLSYTYTTLNNQPIEDCQLFIFKNDFRIKNLIVKSYSSNKKL